MSSSILPSSSSFGSSPSIIIAFDIGTSRSGYAYAIKRYPKQIFVDQNWLHCPPGIKTKTALLLDENGDRVIGFGEEAVREYCERESAKEDPIDNTQYILDRHIKEEKDGIDTKHVSNDKNMVIKEIKDKEITIQKDKEITKQKDMKDVTTDQDVKKKSKKKQNELMLFEGFKMNLYGNITERPIVKSTNGKEMLLVVLLSKVIAFLKQRAMERLKQSSQIKLNECDMLYVLTVPSIWSSASKQCMKEAAILAGIPEKGMVFALESDAASLECFSLENQINTDVNQQLKQGTKYIVVDCGGGTVDITVHKVLSPDSLSEVCESTGGNCGSTYIDKQFWLLIDTIFGKNIIDELKEKYPIEYVMFKQDFELLKESIQPLPGDNFSKIDTMKYINNNSNRTKYYRLRLPFALIELIQQRRGKSIDQVIEDYVKITARNSTTTSLSSDFTSLSLSSPTNDDEADGDFVLIDPPICFSHNTGCIKLSHSVILSLFIPVISQIIGYIRQVLSNPSIKDQCSHMFLAGGFSDSKILQQAILQNFSSSSSRMSITYPPYASLAVLKGAVMFGLNPKFIMTRVSKKTYGVAISQKWNDIEHKGREPIICVQNGVQVRYCENIFSIFVRKGQTIQVDECLVKSIYPRQDNQESIRFTLYESNSVEPKFVDEGDCTQLGTMIVHIPNLRGNLDREIELKMKFGDTCIEATGYDPSSSQTCSIVLSFLDVHLMPSNKIHSRT